MTADIPSVLSKDRIDGLSAVPSVLEESRTDGTVDNTAAKWLAIEHVLPGGLQEEQTLSELPRLYSGFGRL